MSKAQSVYFAKCIGPNGEPLGAYKIGCSYGHNDRIKAAAHNLPFSLELITAVPGGMVLEAACHINLKAHRIGGEYFHASPAVEKFIDRAADNGTAFFFITDTGSHNIANGAVEAFLKFHGITAKEICERLGRPPSDAAKMEAKNFRNNKWVAAACLIAASREQFAHWPQDALNGLLGKISPTLERAMAA